MSVCMFVCLRVCMPGQYVCMSVCLFVCLYVHLSVSMSVRLSLCMSVWLYICLFGFVLLLNNSYPQHSAKINQFHQSYSTPKRTRKYYVCIVILHVLNINFLAFYCLVTDRSFKAIYIVEGYKVDVTKTEFLSADVCLKSCTPLVSAA
jgi:hypothetical protein